MLLSLTAVADPVASASSAFQADAAHDGSITFSKPFGAPLKKLWSLDFGGQVSYPIVAGNLVIVIANAPVGVEMAALDVNTGKTIWRKLVNGTPENLGYLAYDSGLLFLQTNDGVLRAYNPANGVGQWSTQLPGQLDFNYVPVAANGYVYAAGQQEGVTVYQIDARSGLLQWSQLFDSGGQGLTFGAGKAYFPIPCNILGLTPNGGRPVWNYYTGCSLGLGLVGSYYDGAFYAPGSFSGGGLIFNSATGKPIGSFNGSMPAFAGNFAYQIAGQSIVASSVSTNNIRWHYAPGTNLSLPPITINGDVYTLSDSGDLYINDGASGRLKQHIHVGLGSVGAQNTAPSSGLGAGQGKLFVPSGSLLLAFGVE
jgi:outer membrane protein assembly factor BamB